MSMLSALTNHWAVAGSGHHGSRNNDTDTSFKVPAWNHSVIKGKHLFLKEKVASTGRQITKAVPEKSTNVWLNYKKQSFPERVKDYPARIMTKAKVLSMAIHLRMKKKWWEKNMNANANMRNIQSQEDFDEQLRMAGDKLTVVHFFSPSCGACKALHYKVCQLAGMHPGLQFLMVNYDEQKEICRRLNVRILPLFRFYKGAEGRISSFSCTISTIHKLKDAFKRHGIQPDGLEPEKGLEESEPQSLAPPTNIPNATADASHNMNGDVATVAPSND